MGAFGQEQVRHASAGQVPFASRLDNFEGRHRLQEGRLEQVGLDNPSEVVDNQQEVVDNQREVVDS
jgi:hypothetical protein